MLRKQDQIESLHARRARNDDNSSTLAQTLEAHILTAFKGEHQFIFELLQNANDAALEDQLIRAQFILKKCLVDSHDYLIFSHTGSHFSAQDVDKICDNGQQHYRDKSKDPEKIGYKGIGFKAVFSVSGCVHVISDDYDFRFDQEHFRALQTDHRSYPWPIIPIANQVNDLPSEIRSVLNPLQVHFVLRIRPGLNMASELDFLQKHKKVLLFLKHIQSIDIVIGLQKTVMVIERPASGEQKFFVNGHFAEGWQVQSFIVSIPESTQAFLRSLERAECPERLKEATQVAITFGAELDQADQFCPNRRHELCSYLPTKINLGFPFIVNADFLLNPERTRLVDQAWNHFLMQCIGLLQFKFLAHLAKDSRYRAQIFQLLPPPEKMPLNEALEKAYQLGFEKAIQVAAFVPALRAPHRLLKVSEVVLDQTGFYEDYEDFDFEQGHLIGRTTIALDRCLALLGSRIKTLSITQLLKGLALFSKNNLGLETQQYILRFLSAQLMDKHSEPHYRLTALKDQPFLLSDHHQLCPPQDLYLPTAEAPTLGIERWQFIHPALSEFRPLLKKLGVREAARVEWIRRFAKANILEGKVLSEHLIPMTRLIFSAVKAKELEEKDWEYLKKLPLKTKSHHFKQASQCYLADDYHPRFPLETIWHHPEFFVSTEYVNTSEVQAWKDFFKKMGVQEELRIQIGSVAVSMARKKSFWSDYLKQMIKEGCPEPNDGHVIQFFMDMDLLEHIKHPDFGTIFWPVFLRDWSLIQRHQNQPSSYSTNRYTHTIKTSYLQFCIRHYLKIPSHQGVLFSAPELFAPFFLEVVGDAFPVATLEGSLTPEQAAFIGFKTSLGVETCLSILDHLNQQGDAASSHYTGILAYLLEMTLSEADCSSLAQWSGQLLSANNTLQSIRGLQYLNTPLMQPPKDAGWLKNLPGMSHEQMVRIAALFQIPIFEASCIEVVCPSFNEGHAILAKKAISEKLSTMALLEAHQHQADPIEKLSELSRLLERLYFISTESLSLKIGNSVIQKAAYFRDNKLYFENKHDDGLTKIEFCRILKKYFGLTGDSLEIYLYLEPEGLKRFIDREQLDYEQLSLIEEASTRGEKRGSESRSLLSKRKHLEPKTFMTLPSVLSEPVSSENLESSSDLTKRLTRAREDMDSDPSDLLWQFSSKAALRFENAQWMLRAESTRMVPGVSSQAPLQTMPMVPTLPEIDFHMDLSDEEQPISQSKTQAPKIDQAQISRLGEQIVYNTILLHYQRKYPDCQLQETSQGFRLTGSYLNKKTVQKEPLTLELMWYNKNLEAQEDRSVGSDFLIEKNGRTRYVEVKASHASKKGVFRVTTYQWDLMQEKRELYRIFRVSKVGSESPEIIKIKDPHQHIQEGHIQVKAYELKM